MSAEPQVPPSPPVIPRRPVPPPAPPASNSTEPRPGESAEENNGASGKSGRLKRRWRIAMPAWAVSALVHGFALFALALVTLGLQPERTGSEITATQADDAVDELEVVEFETEMEELETTPIVASLPVADPGAAAFGDISVPADLAASDIGVGEIQETTIGEIGDLFDTGVGMSTAGMGEAAYFFGVRTVGRRFVFVVDNSNSMNRGKFETACVELMRTVSQLSEDQKFSVIFFSDTAYPLFYPEPTTDLVPATEENKRKLEYWLMTVQRCLKTKGKEAMAMAFAMRPDAIYILGDGAFTDNTVNMMLSIPPQGVTIHTLGFGMKGGAKQSMRKIATRFKGKFTEVHVPPAMEALSRQRKRPSNRFRNGVWGIELLAPPR